jgi:hypothetical protein
MLNSLKDKQGFLRLLLEMANMRVHRFRESDRLPGIPSVTARLVVHLVVNTGGDHGSSAARGRVVDRS